MDFLNFLGGWYFYILFLEVFVHCQQVSKSVLLQLIIVYWHIRLSVHSVTVIFFK